MLPNGWYPGQLPQGYWCAAAIIDVCLGGAMQTSTKAADDASRVDLQSDMSRSRRSVTALRDDGN